MRKNLMKAVIMVPIMSRRSYVKNVMSKTLCQKQGKRGMTDGGDAAASD